jgi:hypothetical protein
MVPANDWFSVMVCIIASIYTSSRLEADRQIHRRESARRLEWFSLGAMRDHDGPRLLAGPGCQASG